MTDDNMVEKMRINSLIEGVLEEHVAATRSQRVEIRNLLLDAIEQAGFDIVGKAQTPVTRPHPKDYGKADAEEPTRERDRHYDRDGYCDNPARGY